jgi:tetratricopeptide (TPR) repeat protein
MVNALFAIFLSASTVAQEIKNIHARTELARSHFDAGKFDKVIELLNPYTDQLDASGFVMLAISYSNKKDFANEVRVLSIIAANQEENYKWQMLLAQAYLKQAGQNPDSTNSAELLTEGIRHLRTTLKMSPKYKPAFDLLLSTLLQQKANNEARELLAEGISKFGPRPDLFKELCRLDAMDGYLVQAVEHCRESIKISTAYPDHYVYLVQALYDQKENIQAERLAVNASKRFPRSEFVQWATGTLFLKKKNYPVAARYFRTAVKAKPDSSRAQFGLAQSLFEQGQEAEALDYFVKACKADGSTNEVFHTYAGRMKLTKNSALAKQYVQQANTCR